MRRLHRHWDTALGVAVGVGFLVLSPVLVPIALYLHHREEKRMRAAVGSFACLNCGGVLGEQALQLADEAWSAQFGALAQGGIRRRIVKTFDAMCPHCGAQHKFMAADNSFILAQGGHPRHQPTGSSSGG
jgi:hypothetical protein